MTMRSKAGRAAATVLQYQKKKKKKYRHIKDAASEENTDSHRDECGGERQGDRRPLQCVVAAAAAAA